MTSQENPPDDGRSASPRSEAAAAKLFRSEELFRGDTVVRIDHEGAIYRLQITSRGKLILQK